jgi:hypothetical protein
MSTDVTNDLLKQEKSAHEATKKKLLELTTAKRNLKAAYTANRGRGSIEAAVTAPVKASVAMSPRS